jgi:dinuclear metal center YbgI/SA1388 family protein
MSLKSGKSVGEVIRSLNGRAPLGTAAEWDNVGLLIGDPQTQVSGAVVSIDLTFEAVDLAIQNKYNLIINHHPCIFPKSKGLSRIVSGSPIFKAIQNGISVAAYHTNFDQSSLEVVRRVAQGLGLQPKGRLFDKASQSLMKLVAFVPETHLESVRIALWEAGAGHVGNYDFCSFGTSGEGTFRGTSDAQPFLGSRGQLEKVAETRLETVFPRGLKNNVVEALMEAHPYEEVAYDLYAIEQSIDSKGLISGLGYGFWGEFPSMKPFSDVVKDVKSLFDINGFWITNPVPSHVTRVGFVAGKGASFVEAASAVQCDLFITGEAGYHIALGSSRRGLAVMELGHRESETFFVETMKNWLSLLGLEIAEAQTPTQKIWLGGTK